MKLKVFLALIVLHISSYVVFPCSMGGLVLQKFDTTEYIFIGTVEGHVENVRPRKLASDEKGQQLVSSAAGVLIKPKETVFTPNSPSALYEVFDFDRYADCSQGGMKLSDVRRQFPIGSEVRVIAREAYYLPPSTDKNVVRLEIIPKGLSSISTNINQSGKSITSASSIFDYRTYDPVSDSLANYTQPDFELRKDLLRLEAAKDQDERNRILDRIVSAPGSARFSFDLAAVFRQFTSSHSEHERYLDIVVKKLMTEDEFRQYKAEQKKVLKKP